MNQVPFVLVTFADGHAEVFPEFDADVFDYNQLTLTPPGVGRTLVFAATIWLRATAYDAQGYPLYERRAGAGAKLASDARELDALILPVHRAFVAAKAKGCPLSWNEFLLDHARGVLKRFYESEISMSSVQPVLDLAVALNPEVRG